MKNKYMGGGLNKRSMYEKGGLSKAQKKMDKNNNNKIDSQDLAMLRKAEEGMKMKYQEGGQIKQRDTDKLSFGEAFDFYRNELGGGERCMWKGKPYTTATQEELLQKELEFNSPKGMSIKGSYNKDAQFANEEDSIAAQNSKEYGKHMMGVEVMRLRDAGYTDNEIYNTNSHLRGVLQEIREKEQSK